MTEQTSNLRVRILGGGIAGLSCALALLHHTAVRDIRVFESASSLSLPHRKGHGLILMENGVEALHTLKATDLFDHCTPLTEAIFQNEFGGTMSTDALENVYCVSRIDIVNALMKQLPEGMVMFNQPCQTIEMAGQPYQRDLSSPTLSTLGNQVGSVQFESGWALPNDEFDLLIDASGGRSPLCHALNPALQRPLSRVKEIVTSTYWPNLAAELGSRFIKTIFAERGVAFGLLAPDNERVIGFLQFDSARYMPPARGTSTAEMRHFLQTLLYDAPELVTSYLAQADLTTAHLWHPVDAEMPALWSCTNAVAIGDAAHPFLPFTSQGTSAALEDSVILADVIASLNGDWSQLPQALSQFSESRRRDLAPCIEGGRRILADFVDSSSTFVLPYIKSEPIRVEGSSPC